MKTLKMKTLKFQIILVSFLLLCIFGVFIWLLMRSSFEERRLSVEYVIKNKITGHLNAAAAWQAIERGCGATILGGGEGDSSPLFLNYLEMIKKGDTEVLHAERHIKELISVKSNETFEEQLNKWHKGYEALLSARPRITSNDISIEEWLNTATLNINNEFDLSNTTFVPQRTVEKILYFNNVLRPNIAKLCEYVGRERALIGNTIASGKPFSNETKNEIKRYRSIVDQSLVQVLILKGLSSTSSQMKQVIEEFEEEFLQSFQLLREEVFASSNELEDEIEAKSVQMTKRTAVFRSYLNGISNELLSMSRHESVIALAKAMLDEEQIHLSGRLGAVENLFKVFSQEKKIYAQVRYLDSSGHERVRVDLDGNTAKIIHGTLLQNKSNRYYFNEAINLPLVRIYVSPLDLNIERGGGETPYKPVIRFATPVYVEAKRVGIVIFNLLVNNQSFLHKDIEGEGVDEYILVNQNGYYLHHPDEAKEWGMIESFNKSHHNIRHDYPDVAEQILSGDEGNVHSISGRTIVYKPFFLNTDTITSDFWVIIKQIKAMEYPVDAATWFDRATKAINTGLAISNTASEEANYVMLMMESTAKRNIKVFILIFIFAILIFIFFIWWSRNHVLMPIQELTRITQEIAKGNFSFKAEVKSNNEIGCLSNSFNKMAADLQESYIDLRESEEQFRSIFEQAAVGIAHLALNGQYLKINKRFCEITGYDEQEILGRTFRDITYQDDIYIQDQLRNGVLDGKLSSYRMEKRYIRKDGTIIWGNLTVALIRKPDDKPNHFVSVVEDITERKRTEEELHKLSHAVEQSSSTIIITDTKGNIEYTNPKFTQLTGYSLEEVIGKTPRILKSGKTSPEVYKELWKAIISGNEWRGEFCNRRKNGDLYWESASISPVKNSKGVITNFIAIKDDITERRKMEEMLLQSEKLKSLGTITAGVAHEFNNILAIILGSAEVLEGGFKDDGELKNGLNAIINASDDGAEIIKRMLTFAKTEITDISNYIFSDIRYLIRQAIDFTMPRWKNMAQSEGINYHIDKEGMKKVPKVFCNPTELREVFVNMMNNALDAMPDGGSISFSTKSDENTVFVTISDTGKGMPEEVKKKIFEPFFTTQRPRGTGLGMSITYGIITRLGGMIEVESEEGKGTTFNLSIPICKEAVQKTEPPEPGMEITTKKLRVLVIDDEEDICMILSRFLSREGHIVKTINNGTDAIELAGKEDFDLILCDLAMPEVTGYDVIKALNELEKRPKIGLMTGWCEEIKRIEEEALKVDFICRKPFNLLELVRHINDLAA